MAEEKKDFMKIEDALEIVLDLAGKHRETRREGLALDTVEDFYHNVIMEGRHEPESPKGKKETFWILLYKHRHGEDTIPMYQEKEPTEEEMIAQLDDWEPERGETVEAIGPFETSPQTRPKVLIWMEGGLIVDIQSNQKIEAVVIEWDKDAQDEELTLIKRFGEDATRDHLVVRDWGTIEVKPERVEHYFSEARKEAKN